MRLIVAFGPDPQECGLGYYRRLAAANGLTSWKDLAAAAGLPRTRAELMGAPDAVAQGLELDPTWTAQASAADAKAQGWRGMRRGHFDAVCPACLEEGRPRTLALEHALVTSCVDHRIDLVDRCPACRQHFSQNRPTMAYCACGEDLRTLPRQPTSMARQWLTALIASEGMSSGAVEPQVIGVTVGELAALVRLLCLGADPTRAIPRSNLAIVKSVDSVKTMLGPLESMLTDWPRGFESHIEQRLAHTPATATTLHQALGPWYRQLVLHTRESALAPFIQAVDRVVQRHLGGIIGFERRQRAAAASPEFLYLKAAARQLGVSTDAVQGAFESGILSGRRMGFGRDGYVYQVRTEDVVALSAARERWTSEDAAAESAGLPVSVLRNLIDAGVVDADPQWRSDVRKGGSVSVDSLAQFKQSLESHCTSASKRVEPGALPSELVRLADMTGRRLGDKGALQRLFRAMATGEVRATKPAKQLGRLTFHRSELEPYLATLKLERCFTIQALVRATGWKWESIDHWIKTGLLESQPIEIRGQASRAVDLDQLVRFLTTHVVLADLARSVGGKSSSLSEQLSGVEIVGGKPLPGGASRGGLIRLKDLARCAIQASSDRRSVVRTMAVAEHASHANPT